jgi:hypothetical protein
MENNNLSQAKQVTAHNAFFDYMVTRYYPTEKGKHAKSFNSNNIHSLTFDLWERYLNGSLPSTPPTTPPSTPPPATPTTYTLTTTATNGTITRSPNQTSYTDGTIVTLTASANSGYQFSGWSGACSGTSTTCTVSIT